MHNHSTKVSRKNKTELKLVEVHGQKLNTTSEIVAKSCGISHEAVIKLTRKYINDLKDVGEVRFEIRHNPQGSPTEIALLDDYAAMLLLTHMRSNDIVAAFKKALVKEFKRMRAILSEPGRKEALQFKRDEAGAMTELLQFVRETHDKGTNKNHYSNEHLFCNRALTGKWGPINEADLDVYDAKLLRAIRRHNQKLITRYLAQKDRQQPMDDFVAEYRAKNPRTQLH